VSPPLSLIVRRSSSAKEELIEETKPPSKPNLPADVVGSYAY
jgi:hypothetical protein